MPRLSIAASLMMFLFGSVAAAQDKPDGVNPVDIEVSRVKQVYEKDLASAKEVLLTAYDKYEKLIAESPKLNAENRVKLIELLRRDRKAFESEGIVTSAIALRASANTYRSKVAAARRTCEKAFDAAAEKFVKKDLPTARAILDAKAEYLKNSTATAQKGDSDDDRRMWRFVKEHGGGYFKLQADGSWEEIGRNGDHMGTWVERQRTKEYVELLDQKRGYLTRLGDGKAWLASVDDGKFGPSPHGDWEK